MVFTWHKKQFHDLIKKHTGTGIIILIIARYQKI
jgi:hypothetical protein